ncbi:MAG: DUF5671 domain-containing protein [Patescibacteria group bacterium]|nr:DUF5671 domain-containing protein [Patescibacteria group bacterium]
MENNLSRDVFLYLLSVIALAFIAVSFGSLIFQIINIYLPDVLSYAPVSASYDAIRWSIAVLLIVFPVYIWIMNFLRKDTEIIPEKKNLKIRRWLLNFTLFISAIVIVGDVIGLIYNFLRGELILNFFMKVIVIFIIAIVIFIYYLKILRSPEIKNFTTSVLPKITAVIIFIGVVAGLFVAGLPKSQRLIRFDEKRISDLSFIQSQLSEYWRKNEKLPDVFDDLKDGGLNIPADPQTGAPYGYKKLSNLKYEICANFQTSNKDNKIQKRVAPAFYYETYNWNHEQGIVCFERSVNPGDYKPVASEQ